MDPGSVSGFSLSPVSQYINPCSFEPRVTVGAIDLGAYELGQPVPHYGPEAWPLGQPASGPRSIMGPPQGK